MTGDVQKTGGPSGTPDGKSKFLSSFESLRGIAILIIIAGHCFNLAGVENSEVVNRAVKNLIVGGTALFVFISGYLFHHVFYPRFNYVKFLKKKMKWVALPYLVLSTGFIVEKVFFSGNGRHLEYVTGTGLGSALQSVAFYLASGRHLVAYWYISFIMLVFLLSPLFVRFIKMGRQNIVWQALIVFLVSVVAVWVQRPIENLNPLQSLLYFSPVYLLGILFSQHKEAIMQLDSRLLYGSLIMAPTLAMLQAFFWDTTGNFHRSWQESMMAANEFDIAYLQKIALLLAVWGILKRFEGKRIALFSYLAQISFGLFFIHPIVIYVFRRTGAFKLFQWGNSSIVLVQWVAFFICVTVCSILLVELGKRLSGRFSRMVLGC